VAGPRADCRVGGINPVNVAMNLAEIGLQRRGQGYRRGVGASPAEGGDITVRVNALKASDYRDDILLQGFFKLFG